MWHYEQQPALDEQGAHGHRFVIAEELERGGTATASLRTSVACTTRLLNDADLTGSFTRWSCKTRRRLSTLISSRNMRTPTSRT